MLQLYYGTDRPSALSTFLLQRSSLLHNYLLRARTIGDAVTQDRLESYSNRLNLEKKYHVREATA